MSTESVKAASIPGSGYITAAIDLGLPGLRALALTGAFTGDRLTFQVPSPDGLSWQEFYDNGNPVELIVAAGPLIELDPDLWRGVTRLKIRAGTKANPDAQPADANIVLIGNFLSGGPVLPNPRRTLTPERIGFAGDLFEDIPASNDDTFCFDLIDLLGCASGTIAAESVYEIVDFSAALLAADGSFGPSPSGSEIGGSAVSGTVVVRQFGNWPTDRAYRYRIKATVMTTRGNLISVWSYVNTVPNS